MSGDPSEHRTLTSRLRLRWGRRIPPALLLAVVPALCLPSRVVAAGWVQSDEETPQQILERAVSLQQQNQPAAAVELYLRLLNMGYRHPDLLTNLGAAYAAMGNLGRAISVYEEAKALGGDSVVLHFNLGLAYYKSARGDLALQEFSRALELDPNLKQARLLAANLYFQQEDTARVIELLMPIANQADTDPAVAYLLGTALLQEGRDVEGQRYVDAVMRGGDSAPAHVMLATAHLRAGKLEDAIREIEKAISLAPDLAGSHAILGRVLLQLNEVERAKTAFQRELELDPNSYDANFHLGSLLKEERNYEAARPLLIKALQLRPGSAEALYQLGELHLHADDPQSALEILQRLVQEAPRFAKGHALLAAVYHRLGMKEDADRERQIVVQLTREEQAAAPRERRTLFGSPSLEELEKRERQKTQETLATPGS